MQVIKDNKQLDTTVWLVSWISPF